MRIPRKVLIGSAVLVGFLLAALAALPYLIDANSFRPILQAQIQERLQRPASLGNMSLRLFPFEIRISDAVLGQPEGFVSQQPFLSAKEIYARVDLWPLIHREISINAIQLKSPRIELIRNSAGTWNYETREAGSTSRRVSGSFALDQFRIEDGQVVVDNQENSTARGVYQHIDLTMNGLGPNRRGSLAGTVRLDNMAAVVSVSSEFDNAEILTAKGTATLKSDNNKDPLELAFDVRDGPVLTVNSLTAKLGSLSAAITGSVDTQVMPPALHLSLTTANAPIGDLIRIAALYGARVPADLKAEGFLRAEVQVTGTTEKPVFAGKIEATKAQITAKDLVEPVRSSELQIDFTPDALATHPFTVETGGTRLTAQATVKEYSGTAPKVSATLKTTGASVEELLRIANAYGVKPLGLKGSGTVSLDMKVSSAGKNFGYSGSGSLRNVLLASPDLPKTLNVPTADIKFADDRIAFDHLQAVFGSMHIDGAGSLRDFTRPKIQFDLHLDQVNVAEIREWGVDGGKQKQSSPSRAFKNMSANGTVTVGKILYDQFVLNNIRASVALENGLLRLDPATAVLFGGQESGAITADLGAATTAYSIKARLSGVDANQLLSSTTSLKNVLSGALSGGADLQFLSRPNEDIAKTLNGKVQFQMGQGRLAGIQILNEVANLGRFLGYAKKPEAYTNIVKLTGTLNVQNGVASTNDLFMDLGGATLSGTGNIGLVDQSLKLRVTTVMGKDLAQKSVLPGQIGGLLNTVLANQQGELVVPMLVTGTFAQPKFTPDAEQVANLKLRGLLPTAANPGAFTSGVKNLVEAITGKQSERPQQDKMQDTIINLFDQLRNKKTDDNKK